MKTWLACDEHVDFLREFLGARDFPLTVSPMAGHVVPQTTSAGGGTGA